MNNKKTIIILILVLTIGIVGLTVAYFSNSTTLNNIFETKPYGDTFTEEFVSPDNWLPGDTTDKSVVATNTGEVDQAVRVKLTESWKTANNGTLNGWITINGNKSSHLEENEPSTDERVAIINFDNSSDWIYSNGYYYYNYKLGPNESTSSLIKSVTFNSKTKLDDTCIETPTATGRTITCESSGNDYDDATYTLTFNIETVQYNKYQEVWGTDIAIAEEKQRMLKGLKANVADATFENGDKTAMFEFSHPATEQTPALTDYRYIGHMPNNYVKFNCDNDGTNCEIWRIIGVFSVDDGEGNYEQRIKLVRGSAISGYHSWDTEHNDWTNSAIESFLNGDYLNREGYATNYGIKDSTQNMIDDVKYYLGALNKIDSTSGFGSAEQLYIDERGNTACGTCNNDTNKLAWIGKIGLLYSSDAYLTYAKGVEDECYENPEMCYFKDAVISTSGYVESEGVNNHPEAGWIYNTNSFEGQSALEDIWLLSTDSDMTNVNSIVARSGKLVYGFGGYVVRPVLYLKPTVTITGGEGSSTNPYTLSGNNSNG